MNNLNDPSRLEENFELLSQEIATLKYIKDEAARRGKQIRDGWLETVEDKEREVDEIEKEFCEQKSRHQIQMIVRITLNRRVVLSLKHVQSLRAEGNANLQNIEMLISQLAGEKPKRFSPGDLRSFTSNYSSKVGSGAYGDVYKGKFHNGVYIAVKVLVEKNVQVIEETFMAEVSTMGRTYHRNLIKLYGFCFDANIKALVYEYMEKGSLDKILYENYLSIEWKKLYGIAIETAKGLAYLHDGCYEQIIHHDVKAGNVLVDSNFTPKVTDFGLAKLMNRDVTHLTLTRTRGTPGYAAPETWMPASVVTSKCDVYSFGMMMFEVLGKKNNGLGENWFPGQVWKKFENGQLDEIIEDCGIGHTDRENATILSIVALWCVQHTPQNRPSMSTVVKILEKEIPLTIPPNPFLPSAVVTKPPEQFIMLPSNQIVPYTVSSSSTSQSPQPVIDESSKKKKKEKESEFASTSDLSKPLKSRPAELNSYDASSSGTSTQAGNSKANESDGVVIYTSTTSGIKILNECNDVHLILQSHQIKVYHERDIGKDANYRRELMSLTGSFEVPVVFVKGKLIGGASQVKQLEEEGKLWNLFDEFRRMPYDNADSCAISKEEPTEELDEERVRAAESILECFEIKNLSHDEKVFVYVATEGSKEWIEKSNDILSIVKSYQIWWMGVDMAIRFYHQELSEILERPMSKIMPALFVKGRFMGGAKKVKRLEEEGILKILLYGIPKK
ncbi:Pr5-like receptor kinase [Thalictrum thalictroides]|uniref:non-specific serine/threonine protein kinase n=1 Tax=Thalictrum thalictroides TaxID=46969 RepID=A0A7J6W5E4_THATH|nr:Pr5-like receptor kinase [Thalictrum thalictroides]